MYLYKFGALGFFSPIGSRLTRHLCKSNQLRCGDPQLYRTGSKRISFASQMQLQRSIYIETDRWIFIMGSKAIY